MAVGQPIYGVCLRMKEIGPIAQMKELVKPHVWMVESFGAFKYAVVRFNPVEGYLSKRLDHPANRLRELFRMLRRALRTLWQIVSYGPPLFVRVN